MQMGATGSNNTLTFEAHWEEFVNLSKGRIPPCHPQIGHDGSPMRNNQTILIVTRMRDISHRAGHPKERHLQENYPSPKRGRRSTDRQRSVSRRQRRVTPR